MRTFLIILAIMSSFSVYSDEIPIRILGEVVIPPCTINGGNLIKIDFPMINVKKINGRDFSATKSVDVECGWYDGNPYYKFSGQRLSGAPDNVLKATVDGDSSDGFGLAFYQGSNVSDENKMVLVSGGAGYKISDGLVGINSSHSVFSFTVVPWKASSDYAGSGNFSASAMIEIYYQ